MIWASEKGHMNLDELTSVELVVTGTVFSFCVTHKLMSKIDESLQITVQLMMLKQFATR